MVSMARYIKFAVRVLAYYASYAIPRSGNLWVFGSWGGQKFADNSKYLFLYTTRNHPEIRAIWLTHNDQVLKDLRTEGFEAYKAHSLKGFLYSLRAKCVVVSCGSVDVNGYVIGGAKRIQLWHGTPLKKIGCDYDDTLLSDKSGSKVANKLRKLLPLIESKIALYRLCNFHIFIAASEESRRTLGSAFKSHQGRVYVTGYPRNDALMNAQWLGSGKCEYLNNIRHQFEHTYVFSYFPTYRDAYRGNPDLFARYGFDTNAVEQILERLDAILIMKGHYIDNRFGLPGDHRISQRVYVASDEELPDIYPLLMQTDVLITDYSSVYFDFLLLNRPIVFAPFDLEEYMKEDRGFYYDYEEVTPGPKAKDWPEVMQLMEQVLEDDKWREQREAVCIRFNQFRDNNSSERMFQAIQELLA